MTRQHHARAAREQQLQRGERGFEASVVGDFAVLDGGVQVGAQEHALAAYRQSLAITGTTNGWQSLSTALSIVRILTDQVETGAALAALRPYDDLQSVAPGWRIRLLRAYGHVYAAQGKEQESLTKFREALQLESQP